jgi:Bacterial HORMA domain family 1
MYSTFTNTTTYTVVDIRKTFEGFSADLRMIAARTEKLSSNEVDNFLHDILTWAEAKYLNYVDITLLDLSNSPIRASRYSVDELGKALQSDRAGNNWWPNQINTRLTLIVSFNKTWSELSKEGQEKFKSTNNFKNAWGPSAIDNSYSHLSRENAQLYASKGYELKKENFK